MCIVVFQVPIKRAELCDEIKRRCAELETQSQWNLKPADKIQKELGAVACSQSSLKERGYNLSHKAKGRTGAESVLPHGPSQSSLMKTDAYAITS